MGDRVLAVGVRMVLTPLAILAAVLISEFFTKVADHLI